MAHFQKRNFILVTILCVLSFSYANAQIIPEDIAVVETIQLQGKPLFMALIPDAQKLYVVKQAPTSPTIAGSVWIVDTETNTVFHEIGLDEGFPLEIAVTPDGNKAYVAVSEALGEIVSTGSGRVEVIDTSIDILTGPVYIEGSMYGPTGVASALSGERVYVTHRGDDCVFAVNTATAEIDTVLQIGEGAPVSIAVTPDGSRLYVVHRENSAITVIATADYAVQAVIPLSLLPSDEWTAIALTPDGSKAYVTYSFDTRIAVIDTHPESPTFNQEIDVLSPGYGNLAEIAVSPDGSFACFSSHSTGELLVLDTDPASETYHQVLKAVAVGGSPRDIVLHESDAFIAYVAAQTDASLSVVEIPKETTSITAPEKTPDAYVLEPAYPNPFNPSTRIAYTLAEETRVTLTVVDVFGRRVQTLVDNALQQPGRRTVEWHGTDASGRQAVSGVYFITLEAGSIFQSQKIILLR